MRTEITEMRVEKKNIQPGFISIQFTTANNEAHLTALVTLTITATIRKTCTELRPHLG